MNNLIASVELQPLIKEHAQALFDWLEKTGGMQIPLKRARTPRHGGDYRNKNLW